MPFPIASWPSASRHASCASASPTSRTCSRGADPTRRSRGDCARVHDSWRATARAATVSHTTVIHLQVGGRARTYRLHRPAKTTTAPALVVVLHGAGATASEVERRYHWDPLADQ